MKTKVSEYISKYDMLRNTDTIVVGVSGGQDSICLLFLLSEILKDKDIALEVVHVDHGLRPSAHDEAMFVKGICEKLDIPFHLAEADVKKYAELQKISTEEAGRKIRYDAYNKVLGDRKGKIAIAHNANDNAETMLFNLIRGTSLNGLKGIRPVNGNIIRPLLCVTRKEIEEYISLNQIPYVTDESNLTDEYTRNKIRHHILSYAAENINENTVLNIGRTTEMISEAENYLNECTKEALKRCLISNEENEVRLNVTVLLKEDPYIIKRMLREALSAVAGTSKDITSEHILKTFELLSKEGSKEAALPYGMLARKEYDVLRIFKDPGEKSISLPKITERIIEGADLKSVPVSAYTKWFDYDKISNVRELRFRREGDYLCINKDMNRKSLKDYMINEKIPKAERDTVPLIADGDHIMWVIGHRISEYYKVTDETKRILEIRID